MARKDAKLKTQASEETRVADVTRQIVALLNQNGCIIRSRVIIEGASVRSEVVVALATSDDPPTQPQPISE